MFGSKPEGYMLEELAKASGMNARTIRSWVEEGILPAPSKGRGASYPPETLDRLLAAQKLKDDLKLGLGEIRHRLSSLSLQDISELAAGDYTKVENSTRGSASDYIRSEMRSEVRSDFAENSSSFAYDPADDVERIALLLKRQGTAIDPQAIRDVLNVARSALGNLRIERKARAEPYWQIEVNPDIVLSVRGEISRNQIVQYERIADMLRVWLTENRPIY